MNILKLEKNKFYWVVINGELWECQYIGLLIAFDNDNNVSFKYVVNTCDGIKYEKLGMFYKSFYENIPRLPIEYQLVDNEVINYYMPDFPYDVILTNTSMHFQGYTLDEHLLVPILDKPTFKGRAIFIDFENKSSVYKYHSVFLDNIYGGQMPIGPGVYKTEEDCIKNTKLIVHKFDKSVVGSAEYIRSQVEGENKTEENMGDKGQDKLNIENSIGQKENPEVSKFIKKYEFKPLEPQEDYRGINEKELIENYKKFDEDDIDKIQILLCRHRIAAINRTGYAQDLDQLTKDELKDLNNRLKKLREDKGLQSLIGNSYSFQVSSPRKFAEKIESEKVDYLLRLTKLNYSYLMGRKDESESNTKELIELLKDEKCKYYIEHDLTFYYMYHTIRFSLNYNHINAPSFSKPDRNECYITLYNFGDEYYLGEFHFDSDINPLLDDAFIKNEHFSKDKIYQVKYDKYVNAISDELQDLLENNLNMDWVQQCYEGFDTEECRMSIGLDGAGGSILISVPFSDSENIRDVSYYRDFQDSNTRDFSYFTSGDPGCLVNDKLFYGNRTSFYPTDKSSSNKSVIHPDDPEHPCIMDFLIDMRLD